MQSQWAWGAAGDSRAVLCRGDVAMPLTDDHKAAREDEVVRSLRPCSNCTPTLQQVAVQPLTVPSLLVSANLCMQARIEALGGQILYWNGVRVMGVLAVSRAVGDHCLRPYVIAQPEVQPGATASRRELPLHVWEAAHLRPQWGWSATVLQWRGWDVLLWLIWHVLKGPPRTFTRMAQQGATWLQAMLGLTGCWRGCR